MNNINEQTKPKHTHRYKKQIDGCQMEGRSGDCVTNWHGLRSSDW